MKNIFSLISQTIVRMSETRARHAVRQELLQLSDHELRDAGFCPYRLKMGVKAWPWRLYDESNLNLVKSNAEAVNDESFKAAA